jgi:hypothetical protein
MSSPKRGVGRALVIAAARTALGFQQVERVVCFRRAI